MKKIVIDTSVVVKWFSGKKERYLNQANLALQKAVKEELGLLTLDLIYYELINALFWGKKLSTPKIIEVLKVFSQVPITVFAYEENLLKTGAKLMNKERLAFYDAAFVALAQREKCFLLSADEKHHGKIKNVLLLKDYKG